MVLDHPQYRPSGAYGVVIPYPNDCCQAGWGNTDMNAYAPPNHILGWRETDVYFLSFVRQGLPWLPGIPLSVIIPWIFKHHDVNMLISSVSILWPWWDYTVLYRHIVMSRFNQLTRLLIKLFELIYAFICICVYYTFLYIRIYVYIYIYVCILV